MYAIYCHSSVYVGMHFALPNNHVCKYEDVQRFKTRSKF